MIAFIGNSIDPIFNVGEPSEKWTGRRKWAKSIECENYFWRKLGKKREEKREIRKRGKKGAEKRDEREK